MSRPLIGGVIALLMALSPALALAEDAPSSGANTTPAAKVENTPPPSAGDKADPGVVSGGGGAGAGAGAGAGGAGAGGAGGGAGGAGGGG
jgi:hypothetical protein